MKVKEIDFDGRMVGQGHGKSHYREIPDNSHMKKNIKNIDIKKIKSKWYEDVLTQWQVPDPGYIVFLIERIKKKQYIAPIVVVKEGDLSRPQNRRKVES
jgi:hypothetical protein